MMDIIEEFENLGIYSNPLVRYIHSLNIDKSLKAHLIQLVENDSYSDYIEIYNICMENDIELPPI